MFSYDKAHAVSHVNLDITLTYPDVVVFFNYTKVAILALLIDNLYVRFENWCFKLVLQI